MFINNKMRRVFILIIVNLLNFNIAILSVFRLIAAFQAMIQPDYYQTLESLAESPQLC